MHHNECGLRRGWLDVDVVWMGFVGWFPQEPKPRELKITKINIDGSFLSSSAIRRLAGCFAFLVGARIESRFRRAIRRLKVQREGAEREDSEVVHFP